MIMTGHKLESTLPYYIPSSWLHECIISHNACCCSKHDHVVPQCVQRSWISGGNSWTPAAPGGSSVRPRPSRDQTSPGGTHRDSSLMEVRPLWVQITKMIYRRSSVVITSQEKIQTGTTAVWYRTSTGRGRDLFSTESLKENEESRGSSLDVHLPSSWFFYFYLFLAFSFTRNIEIFMKVKSLTCDVFIICFLPSFVSLIQ